jgi:hypothetical protein
MDQKTLKKVWDLCWRVREEIDDESMIQEATEIIKLITFKIKKYE